MCAQVVRILLQGCACVGVTAVCVRACRGVCVCVRALVMRILLQRGACVPA